MMRPVASTAQSTLEHAIMLKCYLWTSLLWCKHYIFHHRVWYRVHSVLCVYLTFGHHPHPVSYLCAKFHFGRTLHCWARPRRKIAYSITHPAYLMRPKWNRLRFRTDRFWLIANWFQTFHKKESINVWAPLLAEKPKKNNPRAKHNLAAKRQWTKAGNIKVKMLPLLSARRAVTFPAKEHHCPLTGTKSL